MNAFRTGLKFAVLQAALGIAAGMVLGIILRVAGIDRTWGEIDATTSIRLLATFAIAVTIFVMVARKYREHYFQIGGWIALISTVIGIALAYAVAPPAAKAAYSWGVAVASPLAFQIAALLVSWPLSRFFGSSSNTSLERTRER